MNSPNRIVFLLDIDNTLIDNDGIVADLGRHLETCFGKDRRDNYFAIFEQLRSELGYADYLGALQRYRLQDEHDPRMLEMSSFLVDYPFADRLFSGVCDVIAHLRQWGPVVILSDGDAVFQPRKAERSGLWKAVEGRVLIYVHKEKELDDVLKRYPADHYVLVDDKLRILTAVKQQWGKRVTTVFVRQGHYATDPAVLKSYPPADRSADHISDLRGWDLPRFFAPSETNR
jgi:FMN phosphatase YigB (HAD superfamily)